MDTNTLIAYLTFFNEHIFTPENVTRAKALGQSLADIIAEIYTFAQATATQAPGARSLDASRALAESGVGSENFNALVQAAKTRDLPY